MALGRTSFKYARTAWRGPTGLLVASVVLMTSCGNSSAPATRPGSAGPSVTTASRVDAAGVAWLCRPGLASDPCQSSLAVTSVAADGSRSVSGTAPGVAPAADCFYVYPTVSLEPADNADLQVQASETTVAMAQAAPFSQVCRIWAPMYRQRTVASLGKGVGNDPSADATAYASLLTGWTDYLDHYNDGRPIVFIGHSQGAAMLIRLLRSQIDPNPALRERMVSAIIAGGNVEVPSGGSVGSTFQHLPLCGTAAQTGCIIAYSTFPGAPPVASVFGRPGQGVSLQSGQTSATGLQVACVNPANLGGGTGVLDPWFVSSTQATPPPPVTTPWVTFPSLYTAACHSAAGSTWLEVDHTTVPGDTRPLVSQTLGPGWGFHLDDINLATGNLVTDVRAEEHAYSSAGG